MQAKDLTEQFGTEFVDVDGGFLFQYQEVTYFVAEDVINKRMKKLDTLVAKAEPFTIQTNLDEAIQTAVEEVINESTDDTPPAQDDAPVEIALRMCQFEPGSKWKKIEVLRIQNDKVISREDVSSRQSRHAALRVLDKQIVKYFSRGDGVEE